MWWGAKVAWEFFEGHRLWGVAAQAHANTRHIKRAPRKRPGPPGRGGKKGPGAGKGDGAPTPPPPTQNLRITAISGKSSPMKQACSAVNRVASSIWRNGPS